MESEAVFLLASVTLGNEKQAQIYLLRLRSGIVECRLSTFTLGTSSAGGTGSIEGGFKGSSWVFGVGSGYSKMAQLVVVVRLMS